MTTFHPWYNGDEYKVIVDIKSGVVTGQMPGRAIRMILEWLDIHRDELITNWEKVHNGVLPDKIAPLQ